MSETNFQADSPHEESAGVWLVSTSRPLQHTRTTPQTLVKWPHIRVRVSGADHDLPCWIVADMMRYCCTTARAWSGPLCAKGYCGLSLLTYLQV